MVVQPSFRVPEHDSIARKSKGKNTDEPVDIFRGVRFEDWLRVFMQVEWFSSTRLTLGVDSTPPTPVRVLVNKTQPF